MCLLNALYYSYHCAMKTEILITVYLILGVLEAVNFKREFPNGKPVEVLLTILTMPLIKCVAFIKAIVMYVYNSIVAYI